MGRKKYAMTDFREIEHIPALARIGILASMGSGAYQHNIPINFVYHSGIIHFHFDPATSKR